MRRTTRRLALPLLAASIALSARAVRADDDPLRGQVTEFLNATTSEGRAKAAAEIAKGKPEFSRVGALLAEGRKYSAAGKTGWLERSQLCSDGKSRPYLLYVPKEYDAAYRQRLVLDLHGGVARPRLLTYEELEQVKVLRGAHAEKYGYFLALPTGETKAEWWTEVGASNVLGIVEACKREWNIDENRVFATGFSDGGSGSYYLALAHPTPFAGFEPLNGHLAVVDATGLEVHLRNLRNKPIYAVNTDLDSLYPSAGFRPIADALVELKAPFHWREIKGFRHDPSYLATEREPMWDWELAVKRSPHPTTITWEGTPTAPSRVHGLGRVLVKSTGGMETFPDVDPLLPPGRPKLGIVLEQDFPDSGVRIQEIAKGSLAEAAGLAVGDVIVGFDDRPITSPRDLRNALDAKKPGDKVRVRAKRGDGEVEKSGTFPDAKPEPAFKRGPLHGAIEVVQTGNRFAATCGNVSEFELWLGVGTVDFSAPVVVTIDGVERFNQVVAPDVAFLLERAAADDDRTMLYGARLALSVPPRTR